MGGLSRLVWLDMELQMGWRRLSTGMLSCNTKMEGISLDRSYKICLLFIKTKFGPLQNLGELGSMAALG